MTKGLKPGTGESTQHAANKQNERGKGVSDHPFERGVKNGGEVEGSKWKSRTNPNPPNVAEGKNRYAAAPVTRPNSPGKQEGRVLQDEIQAHGRQNTSSTFTAPRSNSAGGVTDLGYTKLGKV